MKNYRQFSSLLVFAVVDFFQNPKVCVKKSLGKIKKTIFVGQEYSFLEKKVDDLKRMYYDLKERQPQGIIGECEEEYQKLILALEKLNTEHQR